MGEACVCSIVASVMNYDEASADWVGLGSSHVPSKVQIFQNKALGKGRIVSWSMPDRKVIVNDNITSNLHYKEASETFHHWFSGNRILAIHFSSEKDAQAFSRAISNSLQLVEDRGSNSPVQSRRGIPTHSPEKPQQPTQTRPEPKRSSSDSTTSSEDSVSFPRNLSTSSSISDNTPPPPTGGGPPPPPSPPKPPSMAQPAAKPGGGGGLAAALQGAKLSQSAPAPKPKPAKKSMMEEMAEKLKKRQEEGSTQPKITQDPPERDQTPKPSPLRLDTKRTVTKPNFKSPVSTSPSAKPTNSFSNAAIKELKTELIEAFRKELLEVKEQIVKEILDQLLC